MNPAIAPVFSPSRGFTPIHEPRPHRSFSEAQIMLTTHQVQCQFQSRLSRETRKQAAEHWYVQQSKALSQVKTFFKRFFYSCPLLMILIRIKKVKEGTSQVIGFVQWEKWLETGSNRHLEGSEFCRCNYISSVNSISHTSSPLENKSSSSVVTL